MRIADAPSGASRRRHRFSLGALALIASVAGYSTMLEPGWIEVSRHTVAAPVRTPLVVMHLSDLHTHGLGAREERVVEIVDRERPDLVVVTGDIVDGGDLEPARELLSKLHAPLGVWAVRGNWENWNPPPNERAQLESFGARLLVNEGTRVRADVWLLGLDDPMSGVPQIDTALRSAPARADAARIALFHSPAIFDAIAPSVDLGFAGHTHGGQVRLPLVGALWTPPGSGRYTDGWYSATDATARLFVSRGVGTSVVPVRFFCRPEVAVITIRPGG